MVPRERPAASPETSFCSASAVTCVASFGLGPAFCPELAPAAALSETIPLGGAGALRDVPLPDTAEPCAVSFLLVGGAELRKVGLDCELGVDDGGSALTSGATAALLG